MVKVQEPFSNLLCQGLVLNSVYFRKPAAGRVQYFNPADVDVAVNDKGQQIAATLRSDGQPVEFGGVVTMSKSKSNGVDPQTLVGEFGADTARVFMMFASPPEQSMEWSDDGVQGANRFLKRVWRAVFDHVSKHGTAIAPVAGELNPAQRELRRLAHQTLGKVTDDYARRRVFNTAIASVMELLNALAKFDDAGEQGKRVARESLELALLMLSPVAPHVTHALWQELGHREALIDVSWPQPDAQALVQDVIELVVQVNGKLRGRISAAVGADAEAIKTIALADENVSKWVEGKAIKKVIVVPGKLVNVVV
jgi:leucyl-tRNA synthetase